jgi:hypothetical protein
MNSGQTMMVILAMMLLGTLSLNVNQTLINSSSTSLEMEATLDALSYGQSLLDEILSREFDKATVNGTRVFAYSAMTPPASLRAEFGETFPLPDVYVNGAFKSQSKYNDVDDYNNYRRTVTNSRLDNFSLTVKVEYVDEDDPDLVMTTQTFYKRATVTISNPYMTKDASGTVYPLVMRDLAIYRRYF